MLTARCLWTLISLLVRLTSVRLEKQKHRSRLWTSHVYLWLVHFEWDRRNISPITRRCPNAFCGLLTAWDKREISEFVEPDKSYYQLQSNQRVIAAHFSWAAPSAQHFPASVTQNSLDTARLTARGLHRERPRRSQPARALGPTSSSRPGGRETRRQLPPHPSLWGRTLPPAIVTGKSGRARDQERETGEQAERS